jgi:hypothetical protein
MWASHSGEALFPPAVPEPDVGPRTDREGLAMTQVARDRVQRGQPGIERARHDAARLRQHQPH